MSSPLFTLVTSNQEKIHFATLSLNQYHIPFDVHSVAVPELQTDSSQELIQAKAKSAYELLHRPVVVTDHFWSIPAVGGFPGAYMRFVNDHMKTDDLLRLMQSIKERAVIFTECICYFDGHLLQPFFDTQTGVVLSHAAGHGEISQQVISLTEDGKSIAEHLNAGTDPRGNHERIVWKELGEWLQAL